MRRLLIAALAITLIPAVASAGGGGGNMSPCSAHALGTEISMLDSCFEGIAHFAPAGETITIRNNGELPHTYTAVDGSFDTGQLGPGAEFDLIVEESGIIEVFCTLHGTAGGDGMAGLLLVGEPEVGTVAAASIDKATIKEAVAEETSALLAELSRQGDVLDRQANVLGSQASTLVGFRDAQGDLVELVGGIDTGIAQVTPSERTSLDVLVSIFIGLALGLAIAALLLWTHSARRERMSMIQESPKPEVAM